MTIRRYNVPFDALTGSLTGNVVFYSDIHQALGCPIEEAAKRLDDLQRENAGWQSGFYTLAKRTNDQAETIRSLRYERNELAKRLEVQHERIMQLVRECDDLGLQLNPTAFGGEVCQRGADIATRSIDVCQNRETGR